MRGVRLRPGEDCRPFPVGIEESAQRCVRQFHGLDDDTQTTGTGRAELNSEQTATGRGLLPARGRQGPSADAAGTARPQPSCGGPGIDVGSCAQARSFSLRSGSSMATRGVGVVSAAVAAGSSPMQRSTARSRRRRWGILVAMRHRVGARLGHRQSTRGPRRTRLDSNWLAAS
jgi:hypothetical protein